MYVHRVRVKSLFNNKRFDKYTIRIFKFNLRSKLKLKILSNQIKMRFLKQNFGDINVSQNCRRDSQNGCCACAIKVPFGIETPVYGYVGLYLKIYSKIFENIRICIKGNVNLCMCKSVSKTI